MDEGACGGHSQGLRTLDQEYVLEKLSGRGCVFQAGYQGDGNVSYLDLTQDNSLVYKMLRLEKQVGYIKILFCFSKLYMNQQGEREGEL